MAVHGDYNDLVIWKPEFTYDQRRAYRYLHQNPEADRAFFRDILKLPRLTEAMAG